MSSPRLPRESGVIGKIRLGAAARDDRFHGTCVSQDNAPETAYPHPSTLSTVCPQTSFLKRQGRFENHGSQILAAPVASQKSDNTGLATRDSQS
jgi:hypothetical protein